MTASSRPLVLVVDDELPIAGVIALLVEDLGAEAAIAGNGREALATCRERPVALVITDYMMPVLDGLEFLTALRAEATSTSSPMPPVILMSAVTCPPARGLADAVIRKPFDLDHLDELVRRFLHLPTPP